MNAKQVDSQKLLPEIGARLRTLREDRCLSQQDVEDGSGVSRQQLCRYEKGEDLPSTTALIRLSLFYKVSMQWILLGDAVQEETPNDPALRECMLDLDAASQACRNYVIDMANALMAAERAGTKIPRRT
jgi:transcriptional regulator with XRE-family HTH domain